MGLQARVPGAFVAAWRHIVNVFRSQHGSNVTWLWTLNRYIAKPNRIGPLRNGGRANAYVNWVGIDAYYSSPRRHSPPCSIRP